MAQMEHQFIHTNGVWLHTIAAGPQDGPLIIFLHGFPEMSYGWQKHMAYFAEQGYRVLAPDQRGYNLSDKPNTVTAYRIDELAADIAGLVRACGREKAVIVGHDWGGGVAWHVAGKYPELVERLVIINAPKTDVYREYLRTHPGQLLRSLYVLYFQIPRLPEAQFHPLGWLALRQSLRNSSRRGTFSADHLRIYRAGWSKPGAMTAMLNWYRAAVRYPSAALKNPYIQPPTLIIWGKKDAFLSPELARASLDHCTQGKLVMFSEATHWVQHEERAQVNALIHAFLTAGGRT